jgi:acid phosphatase class B
MKKLTQALAFACLTLTAATAVQASATHAPIASPEAVIATNLATQATAPNPFPTVASAENTQPLNVALFQDSCQDPDPWYMFSGIQALTCIFSGQW